MRGKKPDHLADEEGDDIIFGNVVFGKALDKLVRGGKWTVVGAVCSVLTLIVALATLIATLLK